MDGKNFTKAFSHPVCVWCKKPIVTGFVHYQGGSRDHPAHKKCLVVIKFDRRTGGI